MTRTSHCGRLAGSRCYPTHPKHEAKKMNRQSRFQLRQYKELQRSHNEWTAADLAVQVVVLEILLDNLERS